MVEPALRIEELAVTATALLPGWGLGPARTFTQIAVAETHGEELPAPVPPTLMAGEPLNASETDRPRTVTIDDPVAGPFVMVAELRTPTLNEKTRVTVPLVSDDPAVATTDAHEE